MTPQARQNQLVTDWRSANTASRRFVVPGMNLRPVATLRPGAKGISEPSGRIGCLIPGTRQDAWTLEASYCRIYYAANVAANSLFPEVPFSESYAYADIAAVLRKYSAEVKAGRCPEYTKNPDYPGQFPVSQETVINYITPRVPDAAGRYQSPKDFVRVVFWHMVDLWSEDESAVRPDVLWPGTVDVTNPNDPALARYFKTYENQLERQKTDNWLSPINDILTNVLYVAIGVGAIYLLGPMIFSSRK